jgi:hypothetical protein
MNPDWPDIAYPAWRETCSALHLYLQIAGKYRLARALGKSFLASDFLRHNTRPLDNARSRWTGESARLRPGPTAKLA